jgi:hypothetical protein
MKIATIIATLLVLASPLAHSESTPAAPAASPTAPISVQTPTLSPEAREYYLKGAFLRYVAQYIEWPANALPKDAINICMIGQIPFFQGINSINDKVVNNHTIKVNKLPDMTDAKTKCQILLVTKTEQENVPSIVSALKGLPILTFGDIEDFATKGGAMNFYIANNRLAILANLGVIGSANLNVNPRMLKLITVVPNV